MTDKLKPIAHERAMEAAQRFIRAFFNNEGKKPEIQIPCRPEQDDDCVLIEYINQQSRAQPEAITNAGDVVNRDESGLPLGPETEHHGYTITHLGGDAIRFSSEDVRGPRTVWFGYDGSVWIGRVLCFKQGPDKKGIKVENADFKPLQDFIEKTATAEADLAKARYDLEAEQRAMELVVAENSQAREVIEELVDRVKNSNLQIKYLHEKFQETGTGNSEITRNDAAMQSARTWLAANPKMGV